MQLCHANGIAHVQASLLESCFFALGMSHQKSLIAWRCWGGHRFFFSGSASLPSLLDSSHEYRKIIKVQPGPWSCVVEKT